MKLRTLVAAASLMAAAMPVGAMAGTGGDQAVISGQGRPTVDVILEHLDGRAPTGPGTVTTYGLNGPEQSTISWQEFTEMLEPTSASRLPEAPGPRGGVHACPVTCEQDQGQGLPGQQSFFCDDSSGFQLRIGPGSSSGVVAAIPAGPGTSPVCFGFFGPSVNYTAAIISPKVSGGLQAFEGCFADVWTNHGPGYCPPDPFTPNNTWVNAFVGQGNGIMYSVGFPGVFWFDYFIGSGAQVKYA